MGPVKQSWLGFKEQVLIIKVKESTFLMLIAVKKGDSIV